MKIGIEHVAIFSKDTKALKDWYIDQFGWKTVYDNGKGTFFLMASDGAMVEFCMTEDVLVPTELNVAGIRHLAISVDLADFDALVKSLKDANVEIITDASVNDKGIGTFFFRDPEGNILHLIARKTPLA